MKNLKITRFPEADLLVFKKLINTKLEKIQRQLDTLDTQLAETSANKGNNSDWVDDSSSSTNLQLLDTMAHRLRKHHRDLKYALLRIQNKSYGICSVTGKLIDKKRLLAVPTTTKSVAVKTAKKGKIPKRNPRFTAFRKSANPKIISRVISKKDSATKNTPQPPKKDDWTETDNLLENVEDLNLNKEMEE